MKKYTYIFKGTVYPTRVNFTLQGLPEITFIVPDWKVEGQLKIEITDCAVTIKFQTEKQYSKDSIPNVETLKNYIDKSTRQFIDAYCFAHSYNYDLDIESVSCIENNFKYTFPVQGEWNIKGDNNNTFEKLIAVMLSGNDKVLGLVLADFRRSIKYPDATAMHCLRSLEIVRREYFDDSTIADDNKRDKDGWEKMSQKLGATGDSTYKELRKFAKDNRHGVFPKITYEQREKIMNFTRDVINKFIDWKLKI